MFYELRLEGVLRSSHSLGPLRRLDAPAPYGLPRVYSCLMPDEDTVLEKLMGNLGEIALMGALALKAEHEEGGAS
jgi:hypothetical protein